MIKNALKSGFYSTDRSLPWESKEEHEALHRQYHEEYFPEGRSEQDTVDDLVFVELQKQRLYRSFKLKHSVDPIGRRLTSVLHEGEKLEHIAQHVHELIAAESQPSPPTQTGAGTRPSTSTGEAFNRTIARRVVEQTFQVNDIEQYLKLEGSLNARKDKILARLVCIKEFKRQYRPKLIDGATVDLMECGLMRSGSVDNGSTESVSTDSCSTESGSTESGSTESVSTDSCSTASSPTGSE